MLLLWCTNALFLKKEKRFFYFHQWKGYEQSFHSLSPVTWVGACKGPGGVYADDWASYNVFFLLDKTLVYQMWQIRCSSSTLLHYFTLRIRWCAGLAFCFCFLLENKFINKVLSTFCIIIVSQTANWLGNMIITTISIPCIIQEKKHVLWMTTSTPFIRAI